MTEPTVKPSTTTEDLHELIRQVEEIIAENAVRRTSLDLPALNADDLLGTKHSQRGLHAFATHVVQFLFMKKNISDFIRDHGLDQDMMLKFVRTYSKVCGQEITDDAYRASGEIAEYYSKHDVVSPAVFLVMFCEALRKVKSNASA